MVRHVILHQSLDLGQRTGSAAAQMLDAVAAAAAADSVRRRYNLSAGGLQTRESGPSASQDDLTTH